MTRAGYEKLKEELDRLKRVGDSVTATLPNGKKTFDILEVNFPWHD